MSVRLQTVGRWLALLVAAAIALAPVVWTVSTSLKTPVEAQSYPPSLVPDDPAWSNYGDLLGSSAFLGSLTTSLIVTAASTLLTIVVAFPCAYALVRLRTRGRRGLVLLLMLAQAVPGVVFLIPLYSVAVELGLYDTRAMVVIAYTGFLTPFATLVLASFIRAVPVEIEESGLVDGCGRLRLLVHVVVPVARAGLASAAVFTSLFAWNEFLIPMILGGRATRTLTVHVSTFIAQQTIEWGPLTAAVCLVLLPAIAVVLLLQRQLVTGITAGALR